MVLLKEGLYYDMSYGFFPELENVLKKRRLAAGEENLDPTKSPARTRLRLAELEVKPDTPAIVSIRSRVQQLSQRRDSENSGPSLCQISNIHYSNASFIFSLNCTHASKIFNPLALSTMYVQVLVI